MISLTHLSYLSEYLSARRERSMVGSESPECSQRGSHLEYRWVGRWEYRWVDHWGYHSEHRSGSRWVHRSAHHSAHHSDTPMERHSFGPQQRPRGGEGSRSVSSSLCKQSLVSRDHEPRFNRNMRLVRRVNDSSCRQRAPLGAWGSPRRFARRLARPIDSSKRKGRW